MLYFIYGTMKAGKSSALIEQVSELEPENVILYSTLKDRVSSRNGKSIKCKCSKNLSFISIGSNLKDKTLIIDEGQFLSIEQVKDLLELSISNDIYIYGLRSSMEGIPFKTSSYLLAFADELKEIPYTCNKCNTNKAIYNTVIDNDDKLITNWNDPRNTKQKDKYTSLCSSCYHKLLKQL